MRTSSVASTWAPLRAKHAQSYLHVVGTFTVAGKEKAGDESLEMVPKCRPGIILADAAGKFGASNVNW